MKKIFVACFCLAVCTVAFVYSTHFSGKAIRKPSTELDPEQLAMQSNFQQNCTACHANFASLDVVLQNAGKISQKLDWTQSASMPPLGTPQRAALATRPEQLESMQRYMAAAAEAQAEATATAALPIDKIQLPPGFHISVYAIVPGARSMAQAPDGTIFVGTGGLGGTYQRVYAVREVPGQALADVKIILDGLNVPNGVAFKDGDLYVAEVSQILRYRNIEANLDHPPAPENFGSPLPDTTYHGWKFIRFAPDGSLIVPEGAPCNICQPDDKHASIFRISPDGSKTTKIAMGVRNSVGFDFHPVTGDFYFSDNGRDSLGDDIPTERINVLKKGQGLTHYGYPYCHAGKILDPEFGRGHSCSKYQGPIVDIPAHSAPLGLRFYTGQMFPAEFKNQMFVAEHGSWNRTVPQGYQVDFVWSADGGRTFQRRPFAQGWLQNGNAWGRPVDVEVLAKDGSMLISDDSAGVLYRVTYEP